MYNLLNFNTSNVSNQPVLINHVKTLLSYFNTSNVSNQQDITQQGKN